MATYDIDPISDLSNLSKNLLIQNIYPTPLEDNNLDHDYPQVSIRPNNKYETQSISLLNLKSLLVTPGEDNDESKKKNIKYGALNRYNNNDNNNDSLQYHVPRKKETTVDPRFSMIESRYGTTLKKKSKAALSTIDRLSNPILGHSSTISALSPRTKERRQNIHELNENTKLPTTLERHCNLESITSSKMKSYNLKPDPFMKVRTGIKTQKVKGSDRKMSTKHRKPTDVNRISSEEQRQNLSMLASGKIPQSRGISKVVQTSFTTGTFLTQMDNNKEDIQSKKYKCSREPQRSSKCENKTNALMIKKTTKPLVKEKTYGENKSKSFACNKSKSLLNRNSCSPKTKDSRAFNGDQKRSRILLQKKNDNKLLLNVQVSHTKSSTAPTRQKPQVMNVNKYDRTKRVQTAKEEGKKTIDPLPRRKLNTWK